MMSDFCVKCSEKDAQYELLMKQYHKELNCCKERIKNLNEENARLRNLNDALILDNAFLNKDVCLPTKGDV
jgi:hypothetical protein